MPLFVTAGLEILFAVAGVLVSGLSIWRFRSEATASKTLAARLKELMASKEDVDGFLLEVSTAGDRGKVELSALIAESANNVARAIRSLDTNDQARITTILSDDTGRARREYLEDKVATNETPKAAT